MPTYAASHCSWAAKGRVDVTPLIAPPRGSKTHAQSRLTGTQNSVLAMTAPRMRTTTYLGEILIHRSAGGEKMLDTPLLYGGSGSPLGRPRPPGGPARTALAPTPIDSDHGL